MREIEFRGKDIENKWVYGFYSPLIWYPTYEQTPSIKDFKGGDMQIKKDTLCQYTGLKDKNGKKIYEGDIFAVPEEEGYFVVQWGDGYFELQFYGYYEKCLDGNAYETVWDKLDVDPIWDWNLENMEIIGNIYDNPELLGEKQ